MVESKKVEEKSGKNRKKKVAVLVLIVVVAVLALSWAFSNMSSENLPVNNNQGPSPSLQNNKTDGGNTSGIGDNETDLGNVNASGINESMRRCQNTSQCGTSPCGAINRDYRDQCQGGSMPQGKTAICRDHLCILGEAPGS